MKLEGKNKAKWWQKTAVLGVFLLFFAVQGVAQKPQETIRISGVIVDAENLKAVPYATITINSSQRGTVSDQSGYFSFMAYPNDTLNFSSVGYKTGNYVLPASLVGNYYSMVEALLPDTVLLSEVTVLSLPTVEGFSKAFLRADVEQSNQAMQTESLQKSMQKTLEHEEKDFSRSQINQYGYTRMYSTDGLVPPNNLLNPINWSHFIQDLRESRQYKNR